MNASSYRKTIVNNLKVIRKNLGLTSTDLANLLGVSQSKISYIENEKGVLSAEDLAVLSNRLAVPIADFYRGIEPASRISSAQEIAQQLRYYGATLLAAPRGPKYKVWSWEDTVVSALAFIRDDRLKAALCTAFIHTASEGLNPDWILAKVGSNIFLIHRTIEISGICLQVLPLLRQERQINYLKVQKNLSELHFLAYGTVHPGSSEAPVQPADPDELVSIAEFVKGCLHANKK